MGIEELKKQEAIKASNQKKKKWYQKWWGIGLIIIVSVNVIGSLVNSSGLGSSTSNGRSGLSACECSQRWLMTDKSFMKSTDRWKHDECTRKYGGFAGANDACIRSRR